MRIFLLLLCVLGQLTATAQKYTVESSYVSFFSHATIEDIAAEHRKVAALLDLSTMDVAVSIPIKEFEFEKSLMKEHFNEKYMETEKFPKATFQGKVTGFDAGAAGTQKVKAQGKLTIHGVTKEVMVEGTIEPSGKKLSLKTKFIVKLDDYGVTRPQVLWQNIAEQVEVTLDVLFKPI